LPLQLPLSLSVQHDVLYHAGVAGNRRHAILQPNQKPSRNEALEYYRKVAEHYQLEFRQYQTVCGVTGEDGDFTISPSTGFPSMSYAARKVILATGYYDLPNYLEILGRAA